MVRTKILFSLQNQIFIFVLLSFYNIGGKITPMSTPATSPPPVMSSDDSANPMNISYTATPPKKVSKTDDMARLVFALLYPMHC